VFKNGEKGKINLLFESYTIRKDIQKQYCAAILAKIYSLVWRKLPFSELGSNQGQPEESHRPPRGP